MVYRRLGESVYVQTRARENLGSCDKERLDI